MRLFLVGFGHMGAALHAAAGKVRSGRQRRLLGRTSGASSAAGYAAAVWLVHGVPRARTVLAKMRSLRAQATRALLCGFPRAISRAYIAFSAGFQRNDAGSAAA